MFKTQYSNIRCMMCKPKLKLPHETRKFPLWVIVVVLIMAITSCVPSNLYISCQCVSLLNKKSLLLTKLCKFIILKAKLKRPFNLKLMLWLPQNLTHSSLYPHILAFYRQKLTVESAFVRPIPLWSVRPLWMAP